MSSFETTILRQKLILTRGIMILAGLACVALLVAGNLPKLEFVLCSALAVLFLGLQWPVSLFEWQKLGAGALTLCSSAAVITILASSPEASIMSTHYYFSVIIACAV